MSSALIASLSLLAMLVLIWCGMHVAVVLALVSFVGVWLIKGNVEVAANLLAQGASDAVASHIFGVVPLFVLTGFLVARADVGKDAFEVANQLFRRLRGGLGVATVAANAVFAAITGISIASAAVFTRVAVPQMQRFGYRSGFATGVVAGSSVLGMLIPPSLLMILYGFLANQSVGDMFTAGIVPGLLLALAYAVGIVALAYLRPGMVFVDAKPRPVDAIDLMPWGTMLAKLLPSIVMIVAVLGGLYGGLFTATEAGAVGAALALLIALLKRKLDAAGLWSVLTETGHVTVAVSFLIICASIYTRMLAMSGMPQFLVESMAAAGLGKTAFLALYVRGHHRARHDHRFVVDHADRAAADAADCRTVRHEPGLVRRGHRGGGGDRPADAALRLVGVRHQEHDQRPVDLARRHLPRHRAVHVDHVRRAVAAAGLPAAEPGVVEVGVRTCSPTR